jgi:hypothetical protein
MVCHFGFTEGRGDTGVGCLDLFRLIEVLMSKNGLNWADAGKGCAVEECDRRIN